MTEQKKTAPQLAVLAQYIKDLSFENPLAPIALEPGEQPDLNMNFDLSANQVAEQTFEVGLNFTIDASQNEKKAFLIEVNYAGLFKINEENKDLLEQILLIQCPTILFPYVRQVISDVTSKGGYPPVNINPIDFYGFYVTKKQEEMKNQDAGATNENKVDGKKKTSKAKKSKSDKNTKH